MSRIDSVIDSDRRSGRDGDARVRIVLARVWFTLNTTNSKFEPRMFAFVSCLAPFKSQSTRGRACSARGALHQRHGPAPVTMLLSDTAPAPKRGADDDDVPDMNKRILLNIMLASTVALSGASMLGPYLSFFVPPTSGKKSGGIVAKDAIGKVVRKQDYLDSHKPGSRELVQGLNGDPSYLIVKEDGELESYALNAVCTHLGCVVPWNSAENKFICPCHGSQYDPTGKVVRGPAPLPLALAHVNETEDGSVELERWPETDFRTGEAPWWK